MDMDNIYNGRDMDQSPCIGNELPHSRGALFSINSKRLFKRELGEISI